MKIKKVACLLLSCALIISFLAACKPSGSKSSGGKTGETIKTDTGFEIPEIDLKDNKKITIVSTGNPRYDTADGSISKFFAKYYGGEIESKIVSYLEYATTLASMVNSGAPAHLMAVNEGFPDYSISKLVIPVDEIGMDYDKLGKDFAPLKSVYDAYKYDGKHYVLPWSSLAYQKIFYNKKMFEDNELKTPLELFEAGEWTYDAMYDAAKKLYLDENKDGTPERWGMSLVGWHASQLALGGGQSLIKIDGTKLVNNISNSSNAAAMNLWRKMIVTDKIAPQNTLEDYAADLFGSGKAAMVLGPFFWCETDGLFDEMRQTKSLEWVVLPKESKDMPNYAYANGASFYVPQGVKESDYALIKAFMVSSVVSLREEGLPGSDAYQENLNKFMAKHGGWGYTEEDYKHYSEMNTPSGINYMVTPMESVFSPMTVFSAMIDRRLSFEQAVAEVSPGVDSDLEMLVQDAESAATEQTTTTPNEVVE